MMNSVNNKITLYFSNLLKNSHSHHEIPRPHSWDWIMSIVELVEKSSHVRWPVEFHLHENYCRIDFSTVDGEKTAIQDKGIDKKEAVLNCCFRFFQKFDKQAPQVDMGSDWFLMEGE